MAYQAPPLGSPVWIEIPASDVQACKNFYNSLFPTWQFSSPKDPQAENAAVWSFNLPNGLTGGIVQVSKSCIEGEITRAVGHTVYFLSEDIDATQKKIEELGGKSVSEKENAGDHGVYILFKDVEGNRFGIYEARGCERQQ